MTLQIAALASGTGSNVSALQEHIEASRLDARICLLLSNNPQAPVTTMAREKNIPVWARSHKEYPDRASFDHDMLTAIRQSGADTVVLAGYMRILSDFFVRAFPGRIMNIHPAILPSFPGAHGGRDALAYGVRLAGPTVHFVDELMDNGPIIIQAVVPVGCNDAEADLMPRIHALEHRIYAQALQWLAQDRLLIVGRRVELLPDGERSCRAGSCGENESGLWLVSPALEGF